MKPGGRLILGCLNANSEMGKNKHKDPVFQNAHFLTREAICQELHRFKNIEIKEGVYFSKNFEITDNHNTINNYAPALFAVRAEK